jgi:dinuclear metal center YbgI/SA1388 family protein
MTTVADILKFIETIAPPEMKESWDNVGLLCGRGSREVKKILVALDPFATVIDEAIRLGADLIVTHHPLIFAEELKAVNENTETGRCLLTLMEHGIAAINAHTNLDKAPGGINEILAQRLLLTNIRVADPEGTDAEGREWGLIRGGEVPKMTLEQFLPIVKTRLCCQGLRYVNSGTPVRNVCVGGGSCAGYLAEAAAQGFDTFVTADVKYNQFRTAYELGVNLIDAGHFHTENPAMFVLAEKLRGAFPETEVIFSFHDDVMRFY